MKNEFQELDYIKEKCFDILCFAKKICEEEEIFYTLACGTVLGAVRHGGFIPWDTDVDIYVMLPDKERIRSAILKHIPDNMTLQNCDLDKHYMSSHDKISMKNEDALVHLDIYYLCGAPSSLKEQKSFSFITSYADRIIRSKYHKLKDCKKKNRPLVFCAKILDRCIPDALLKKYISSKQYKYNFNGAEFVMPIANIGNERACMPKSFFAEVSMISFNGVFFPVPKDYNGYLERMYGKDYMTPRQY